MTPSLSSTFPSPRSAKAVPRRRAGRPRKAGARHPGGQLVQPADPVIPAQVLARRAELLGGDPADATLAHQVLDQRAGQPLGQLLLRGRLTRRQHDAGQAVGGLWRAWLSLAEAPRPHAHVADAGTGITRVDVDPERWARVDERLTRLRGVIRDSGPHGALALALVEGLCADEVMPRRFQADWTGDWPAGWAALTTALDALADHYRLPHD